MKRRKFRLLILISCIGQFVRPVEWEGGDGAKGWMVGIVILASCEQHFIGVHLNLVQLSPFGQNFHGG